MLGAARALWLLLRDAFRAWSRDRASRWAAVVAYFTLFSLAPLVLMTLTLASQIYPFEAAHEQIVRQVGDLAGTTAANAVAFVLENAEPADGSVRSLLLSMLVFLWGASAVFFAVQDGLNVIWNVPPRKNWTVWHVIRKRLASFLVMVVLGALLLASAILHAILSSFNRFLAEFGPPPARGLQLLDFLITFILVTLLFAVIFRILPDVEIAWSDVWVGAVVTALLFAGGRALISLYLRLFGVSSAYGAGSTFIALLVWVYYSAQIFFFGAEITQVYANRFGSRLLPLTFAPPGTVAAQAPPDGEGTETP